MEQKDELLPLLSKLLLPQDTKTTAYAILGKTWNTFLLFSKPVQSFIMLPLLGHNLISSLPCCKTRPESRSSLDSFPVCELGMWLERDRLQKQLKQNYHFLGRGCKGLPSPFARGEHHFPLCSFDWAQHGQQWGLCLCVLWARERSQQLRSFQLQTLPPLRIAKAVTRDPVLHTWLHWWVFAHPAWHAQLLDQTGTSLVLHISGKADNEWTVCFLLSFDLGG